MPRPKPSEPRVSVLVRFAPDLLARVMAADGDTRQARIVGLIEDGLDAQVQMQRWARIAKALQDRIDELEAPKSSVQIGPIAPPPGSRLKKR